MRDDTPRVRILKAGTVAVFGLVAVLSAFLVSDTLLAYGLTDGGVAGLYVAGGQLVADRTGINLLSFRFGWRMIAIGSLIGIVGPLIGMYIVHREMALIGETLAHTAFAGVAIGLLVSSATGIQTNYLVPALLVAVLGAFLVQYLADRASSYGDVPIAIMLSGSFALGTLVISYGGGLTGISIEGVLFGNVSVVHPTGGTMMLFLSAIVLAIVGTQYKQLLFITFDEQAARVAQLNVSLYNSLLVVLTALVVVGAMQILGVILVAAMLVVPVAAASQIATSFREAVYVSILVGEFSVIVGILGAHQAGLPAGGSIVMLAILCYLAAIVLSDRGVASISVG
ncbi:MAG: metal ABC transporter permease [Halobacteriota archaeon]